LEILENIKNTVVPEMNWDTNIHISYTQFSAWSECPHRWSKMYIEKHKQPPNIHLAFGSAMHETLQEYFELMYNQGQKAADNFKAHSDFQERFLKLFGEYRETLGDSFSSKEELTEFLNDGLNIIDFFLQYRQVHFSKTGYQLLGIEMPVLTPPVPNNPFVLLMGKLDLVMYDEENKKVIIWDIKTSTRGWGKWDKENKLKTSQLVIYKKYFAEQYGVPVDDVEAKYFIVKRKIPDNPKYAAMKSRIQKFIPSSGKNTQNKLVKNLNAFVKDCFEGKDYIQKEYEKTPSKKSCRWCPFLDTEHCDQGIR